MYKVLKDFKGSPDGYTVIEYHEGEVVPLPRSLAEVAIAEKWVEEVAVDAAPAPAGDAAPAPEGDAQAAPPKPTRGSRSK